SASTNQGVTWTTTPINVSNAPGDQFFPWIAVAPNGTINVAYYDDGYDPGPGEALPGMTLAPSTPGGATRTPPTRQSDPRHDSSSKRRESSDGLRSPADEMRLKPA